MTTSGTYTFFQQLGADDIIADAFERCGMMFSQVGGYQLDSAKRSLMLLFADWGNRGPNLWKTELRSTALTSGQTTITLADEVIEVLQVYNRDASVSPSIDYILTGISRADYAALPYKTQSGHRATQYYFQRTITPQIFLWPIQDNASQTFYYYAWLLSQDIGAFTNQVDAPNRWIEATVAGLATKLAEKWTPERLDKLEQRYMNAYTAAQAEDVESVPLRIVPNLSGYRG